MRLFSFLIFLLATTQLLTDEFAVVTNFTSNSITIINVTQNTVVDGIDVGNGATGVAITPDGAKAYITNFTDSTVSVVDLSTYTVTDTISGVATGPKGIAITPDGSTAYAVCYTSATLKKIDLSSNTVTSTINLGELPQHIAITPDGTKAYVTSGGTLVYVVTLSTEAVTSINLGGSVTAFDIAITPDGTKAYVTDFFPPLTNLTTDVYPIDLSSDTAGSAITIAGSSGVTYVAIAPDGATAYVGSVASPTDGLITPITVSDNSVGSSITVSETAVYGLAVSSDSSTILGIANTKSSAFPVTDLSGTPTVGDLLRVGFGPLDVAIVPQSSSTSVSATTEKQTFFTQSEIFNKVTWSDSTSRESYFIYRDSSYTNLIGAVAGSESLFYDQSRDPGTTYTYYVRGLNSDSTFTAIGNASVTTSN